MAFKNLVSLGLETINKLIIISFHGDPCPHFSPLPEKSTPINLGPILIHLYGINGRQFQKASRVRSEIEKGVLVFPHILPSKSNAKTLPKICKL